MVLDDIQVMQGLQEADGKVARIQACLTVGEKRKSLLSVGSTSTSTSTWTS